ELLQAVLNAAGADSRSPLCETTTAGRQPRAYSPDDVRASNGHIARAHDGTRHDTYVEILQRSGRPAFVALGKSAPQQDSKTADGVFSAKFAEVQVDPD